MKHKIIIIMTLFLSACTVGPDYVRPSAPTSATFKEAKGKTVVGLNKNWKKAEPRDNINRGEWWKIFHDPTLNQLEARVVISNQTILNAAANYQQARALVDEARANYFPTITGSADIIRQKQAGGGSTTFISTSSGVTSTGTATTGGGSSSSKISTSNSLFLEATWEPDIWGSIGRTVEASEAGAQASAALLAVTQLSAQASLAQYYFELRGVDTDQKLLNDTVVSYKKALKLTLHQYNSGVAARTDVVQAQSQLEAAQALAINNGILRAQYEHAIAVLIGVPPAEFSLPAHPLYVTPPPIPLTVPSALLERRPDIAQAERLMAQANAQIGVAISAYYPALNLSGSAISAGRNLDHSFALPSIGWSYGLELTDTLYDGGLRSATVRAARATYEATVAAYRQTVLAAFQDVEDNLAALRILGEEMVVQKKAVASARLALKLITNQYKAGTVDYSNVITAQTTAYTAEKNAADIEYLRMSAAVGLIKALGGGWQDTL